jgi:hypothetical protein
MIKTRIASFALAASLFGSVAVGTVAAQGQGQGGAQGAGAAGLVAAVAQVIANLDNTTVEVVTVDIGNSFNNLDALQNFLNNNLNNNNVPITIQDIEVIEDISILNCGTCENVVGVAVLSGGDIIVFER